MIQTWDEIRTAYQVARHGTVSGAAQALGVHHATVIRHVDALEGRLGVKLFQRHARGYTATEAGTDLLSVAQTTDEQFTQLASRLRGRGATVGGELVVTSLPMLSEWLTPILARFQAEHPDLIVRLLNDVRLFRLEYGEAHVALRAGAAPQEPDNVVRRFGDLSFGLYASRDYIARKGHPQGVEEMREHDFVCHDVLDSKAPFWRWIYETIPEERVIFRGTDDRTLRVAVERGAGIGFVSRVDAAQRDDLVEVMEPREDWCVPVWLVTHVDLHRTVKVQSVLSFLRREAERGTSTLA